MKCLLHIVREGWSLGQAGAVRKRGGRHGVPDASDPNGTVKCYPEIFHYVIPAKAGIQTEG
jgi:hypothetical protein